MGDSTARISSTKFVITMHFTQPINDLINLPHVDVELGVQWFNARLWHFIRSRWFKTKKLLRVPVVLRTPYRFSHAVFFVKGGAPSFYTDQRFISIGPNTDPTLTIYPNNRVTSNRYTVWNFIPKNLFEQFRRVANFYFLLMAIIALLTTSPVSPLTSVIPLAFVISVTACKQGYEDYLRYIADQQVNRQLVTVIRNKCLQYIPCEDIVVGDLVKVERDQDIPCDMLVLFSTEENHCCYITTSNLDGETNLKTLLVPKPISQLDLPDVVSMEAHVTCQHPSSDLYSFHGKIEIKNTTEQEVSGHLTTHNLLLRGSRLKDTEYVVGCAIYTGHDTKLCLNSKIRSTKFSTVEKSVNKHILLFIGVLMVEVLFCCTMKNVFDSTSNLPYLGPPEPVNMGSVIFDFLNFTILFNYTVPISLYVTIELQKFLSSFFFSWDIDMYDEATDQPALPNTSDLNEELGQVEYLFADKTGTLTENLMVFRRFSINGKNYMEKDCDGQLYQLPPSGNEEEAVKLKVWGRDIWHFLVCLALCHTVQISPPSVRASAIEKRIMFRESFRRKEITQVHSSLLMHPSLPEYQAASADEKALVEASARCGVVYQNSTADMIELNVEGKVITYKKLEILEFTSERKRMSVVVKDTAGDYWLYCKGADSAILPLIVSGNVNEIIHNIADFSMRGLRILVMAYKKMSKSEFVKLENKVESARQIIGIERELHMERAYNQMESGLTLLGASAVEDRLQENVAETLEAMQVAGIKTWVLTGDKAETAENISFLCGLFKSGTEVLRLLEITDEETCYEKLSDFEHRMKLEPYRQYGFLVDGRSILTAFGNNSDLLRSVSTACDAVVCCRLTPIQKSEIVQLIKNSPNKPHTAAVGDGGNDVSMIQEAHVGIGIMGKEGRQATMSSDYAIAKFCFLKKALLVHGHWFYMRISILTQYFFYKNVVFITPQLLFNIYCGFSTQPFYDGLVLMLFNVLFTSLPIVAYGLFEQNYSADVLLSKPYLYKLNRKNYLLSGTQFLIWGLLACWHTLAIYFMTHVFININPVTLKNSTPIDQWCFSSCVFHIVTLVVNLQVLLRSSYWTMPLVVIVVASELVTIAYALIHSSVHARYDGDLLRVFHMLMSSMTFWALTIIIVLVCLIPDCLIMVYNSYNPMRILRRNEERPRYSNDQTTGDVPLETMSLQNGFLFNVFPWRYRLNLHKTQ